MSRDRYPLLLCDVTARALHSNSPSADDENNCSYNVGRVCCLARHSILEVENIQFHSNVAFLYLVA
jgi:hypothetical protein